MCLGFPAKAREGPRQGCRKRFCVWYPNFFTTQLSYEVRDCFFPIMRHNSPLQCHIRTVPEDELNNEMFMTLNGPEIGELDEILKTVLDLHFKNS